MLEQTGEELQLHDINAVKSLQCSGAEVESQESMIMVLQREMKARLMEIGKVMYLGVYVVYEGEYYFKKMRVKLAQRSGKLQ